MPARCQFVQVDRTPVRPGGLVLRPSALLTPCGDEGTLGGVSSTASSPSMIAVYNPATGELCGEVPNQPTAAVVDAVRRGAAAQHDWARMPFGERAGVLRRFVRRLALDEPLLSRLIAESGKPRFEAEGIEVLYTLELTRFLSGRAGRKALAEDIRRPFLFRTKRARVLHRPRGVVGVIGPWNWPLLNNFADAIAPLLAGNSVVLKPSELTPLTSLRVEELWREMGLPRDVFQVVTGGADTGRALVDAVDLIFFTGSQAAGRDVARRAAERLVPAILELGGKSPMIVLADADLPRAARAAVWSAFANCGQVCIRTERALVERPIAEAFTRLVVEAVRELRQGPSSNAEENDVGPITRAGHIEHLERQIADAVARGGRVVAGGARREDLGTHFFAPTVIAGCTADMAVMNDETFGPILPIMAVEDTEHALRIANDPPGGLSGSIWSRDPRRARRLARRLDTGSVCVNDALVNYLCVEAPIGGSPGSGLGFRHGAEALSQFCRVVTIVEDAPLFGRASGLVAGLIGFPYRTRVLRGLRWLMRRLY